MDDPLAGLDDVPWESLRHTCGPPLDTPGRLRQIARGEADSETWKELFSSITNQDSVDEASAAAAPFLIALTRVTSGHSLTGVLSLLDAIAAGVAREPEVRERCVRAAELGFPRYVELLSATEPQVRATAASLVAAYPERAREARANFEAAIDAERNPGARAELLANYTRFVDHEDEKVRARLRAFVVDPDPLVAARAGFGLMKSVAHAPDPAWVDAVVRNLLNPVTPSRGVDAHNLYVHDVLFGTPAPWRTMLLDALLCTFPDVEDRYNAFDLGGALLWLAFHRRLGGPARPPRPFVRVHSLAFPLPEDESDGRYLDTWDRPQPAPWPGLDPEPTVNVAEPVTAGSLTAEERRVAEALARSRAFWRTRSDLPTVYGLPAHRRELTALLGG